ncbi:MAG TPA: ABC transporter permease [Bryobacteraceae bacterium]|nr:ABC transporter permease [Bryobacteraceae bacterium]
MDWLRRDVRFGFRTLLKDKTFLLTAALALALGIGSTTAIFSVIDNVLLEPFPYTDGQRLAAINIVDSSTHDQFGRQFFSPPEFLDYAEQNHIYDRVIGVRQDRVLITGLSSNPESFQAARVTGNTFQFLGLPPLVGRAATPADAEPGAPPVFVLSYKVWQGRFSGDPNIVGKTFTMDGQPRTLIGIMPKRFTWWGADLWIPTKIDRADNDPNAQFFGMMGHLKPGLTPQSAAADVDILAQRLSKKYPLYYPKKFHVKMTLLVDNVVGRFRQTLYTLLAAVGLLLLIACANVANLLLAKATAREKEFAVRSSLGAGRWAVVRQLLTESLILAFVGAGFGCLFAWGGLKALTAALPKFTFPDEALITLNVRVLIATVVVTILTALIFGLAPALGSFTRNLSDPLKAGGRGNSGFRRGRLRNVLVVGEVALSLLLLTGAGLLMRSFILQRQADLGMRPEKLLDTQISLGKKYRTAEQQARFVRELMPQLSVLPGVTSASAAVDFPPFGGIDTDFEAVGVSHSEKWKGQMGFCDSNYFSTLGARLLRGRYLSETDIVGKRKVVVVNQTLATKFFPGKDPIGKQIELVNLTKAPEPTANPWFEIVGVTSDIRNHGTRDTVLPEAYAPYTLSSYGVFIAFLRTVGEPAALSRALDAAVLKMDKSILPQQTGTVTDQLEQFQYAQPRFGLEIFSVFAAIGLILVSVGVYSVVSYTVSQQNREIGIRMALGASRGNVRRLVMRSGMRFIVIGILVGLAASLLLLRVLASQVFGIKTYDPITLIAVVILLGVVGLAACYVPSVRATRVDPLVSLRYE